MPDLGETDPSQYFEVAAEITSEVTGINNNTVTQRPFVIGKWKLEGPNLTDPVMQIGTSDFQSIQSIRKDSGALAFNIAWFFSADDTPGSYSNIIMEYGTSSATYTFGSGSGPPSSSVKDANLFGFLIYGCGFFGSGNSGSLKHARGQGLLSIPALTVVTRLA